MNVCFTRAEVTALHGVIEKPPDGVAVVLIVLCGIDSALCSDRVRPPRTVLVAEAFYPVAEFAEGRCGGCTGETGADDDDLVFAAIGRVDQLRFELVLLPLFLEGAAGNLGVENGGHGLKHQRPERMELCSWAGKSRRNSPEVIWNEHGRQLAEFITSA